MSPPPGRRLPPCCGPCEACVQLGSRIRGPSMLRWHGRSATPAAAAVAAGAKTAAAGAVAAAGAMAASGAVAVSGLVAVAALAPRALAQPSFRSQSPQPPKASERREVSFTLFFRGPAARFDVNSLQQCNILSDGLVALQSRGQSQSPHTRRAACLHLPVFTRAWPLPPPPAIRAPSHPIIRQIAGRQGGTAHRAAGRHTVLRQGQGAGGGGLTLPRQGCCASSS